MLGRMQYPRVTRPTICGLPPLAGTVAGRTSPAAVAPGTRWVIALLAVTRGACPSPTLTWRQRRRGR